MQVFNLEFLQHFVGVFTRILMLITCTIFVWHTPAQIIYASTTQATNATPKAVWYRYYDSKGVSNISTSVTPNHIKYGYEALDRNMNVIKRNHAYDAQKDIKQESARAAETKRKFEDEKLRRAYSSSSKAAEKRDKHLASIRTQIQFLQDQLRQLNSDKTMFRDQKNNLKRNKQGIPAYLEESIKNNQVNIDNVQRNINLLRDNYRKTRDDYIDIIARLEKIEKNK